ncbi:hypothetical protein PQO03_17080 [Lentisphaera profundi]|uniref:Uncharacterized protein n=1 Tax=Lentisphaera profundi TaxID=1658616 RepID=A0ABY7VXG1_9BACT|nr:hypothetical protein [Lentisphaera profundi]WDE97542.1 hypothetical protein PQO03_17080 [Lentisphaera profundi]
MSASLCLEENFILERPECWDQIIRLKDAIEDLRHDTIDKLFKDLAKALAAQCYECDLGWGSQMDPYTENLAIQISNNELTSLFPTFENGIIIEYCYASDELIIGLYVSTVLTTRVSNASLSRFKKDFPSEMEDSRWHYVLDLIPQGKCFDDSNRVVELTQKSKRMEFAHELMIIIDQYCKQVISQLKSHKND